MQRKIRRTHRPLRPTVAPQGWNDLEPLIARRLELGIPQGAIAGAMSVGQSRVSMLERGRVPVSPGSLDRYREALMRCEARIDRAGVLLDHAHRIAEGRGETPRQLTIDDVVALLAEIEGGR